MNINNHKYMKSKHNIRKPELEQHTTVWLTREAYDLLRKAKRRYKRSMAAIVDKLIKDNLSL